MQTEMAGKRQHLAQLEAELEAELDLYTSITPAVSSAHATYRLRDRAILNKSSVIG